jgi:Tfp pilus assembly protein PilN
MNIGINILPKELRAKPFMDTTTFALIVVILLLAFGSFYFYHDKSSSQSDTANMQSQITNMKQQTTALSTNPEALNLISSIQQLTAAQQSYSAFIASKVLLGNAFVGVYALVPVTIDISSIAQNGNNLVIKGTADSFTDVSDYARALDNDPRFTLLGLPTFSGGSFTLTVSVASGGAS